MRATEISSKWVPRFLTKEQKKVWLEIPQRRMVHYESKRNSFLYCIPTCDETWVYQYTPESKQANMGWQRKGDWTSQAQKECISWEGSCYSYDFLYKRRTVNANYYCQNANYYCQILESAEILWFMTMSGITTSITCEKLEEINWTPLKNPPYRLVPLWLPFVWTTNRSIGRSAFSGLCRSGGICAKWLQIHQSAFCKNGIVKLLFRWQKCIAVAGKAIYLYFDPINNEK